MLQNQHLSYDNLISCQLSKSLNDECKIFENSLSQITSTTKNPFIKVKQVSVVDILKGDDLDSIQSQSRITQSNLHQISQNCFQCEQNHDLDSSASQDSQQFSKTIHEGNNYKIENDHEIQVDLSYSDDNQKEQQTKNEGQRQSFAQTIQQLVKKKRKNNIELGYINSKNIWKKKWLGVLFYVSKFLYIAKQCQKVFRASLLTSFQLHLIGDISSDFEQNECYRIISLFLLFAGSLFYGHLFACIWYYVGNQSEQGWIAFNQLDRSDIYSNYVCSYYYAVVTMTTIGYGDITAKTTGERSVMIFLALLSCGIFGFTINSIGNILSDFKQKSDTYLTELGKLNKYLSFYQVSSEVQINARKYLKFIHQEKHNNQLSSFQSLNNLSGDLQNQIKMEVISKQLKQIQLFRNILKEEIILQLSLQVQENIYQPEQIILGQNEVKEPTIYIINHGRVLKYSQYDLASKENSIVELKEKDNFGLIEFFMNQETCNFNYKSKELTSIFSLQLSTFLKIIKQDNESYEKFCYVKDQPEQQQKQQQDDNKKRKAKKKQNCWKLFDQNYSQAIDFQNNNINQLSFDECSQITEEDDQEESNINDNNKDCIQEFNLVETETRKSIFTQNLLKLSEDRDHFNSHKTGDILNEDDCSIGNIGSELKPQIIIQSRKHNTYDFQKSEEMKKQSSNSIEQQQQQQEDDLFWQSHNSQKNICQRNRTSINVVQNQNFNAIQSLIQNLKDVQMFLLSNQTSPKMPQKQTNFCKVNSKRLDSSIVVNLKKERNSSLSESNKNVKYAKEFSYTLQEIKNQKKKSQSFHDENFDKLCQFKIYYPLKNFDIVISGINKSHLEFKIPQILKKLKLNKII
ncbi:cation channel family protein (macronuclear) [Tetrahymena thermophila SB210]|uniref:Cation channel family protein n=1 Tax=Tetrahymena thermophila (strain SB210) TaxID=312017 RepID=Q23QP7_TETTS|nr:cation channel family protein [Tetrahymena thermophila SB210]EAR98841.2 cation channel family protein [Tetrahymena thermophila SB210]|eukprot:XP_001019086.2 cation channel family protein [Tetrahymena thermophila SB210]